jgi:hypothetical protein
MAQTHGSYPHHRELGGARGTAGGLRRGRMRADPAASPPQQPQQPQPRSALGLRRVLALFGLVFCAVTAGLLAAADWPLPAAVLALLALVAAVDLVVIRRRIRGTRARA